MAGEAIRSPGTGRVVEVHVAAGTVVREGAELILLESMKMEIPVLAPRDAVVVVVHVGVGASVHEGEDLLTLR